MFEARLTRTVSAVTYVRSSLDYSSVVLPPTLTECSPDSSVAASLHSLPSLSTTVVLEALHLILTLRPLHTLALPHVSPVRPGAVLDLLAEGDVPVRVVRHHLVGQSPAPVGALHAPHTELRLGVD